MASVNNAARRNMLLGDAKGATPAHMLQLNEDTMERHNDSAVDELSARVSSLKSLTIDIGNEVREHNRFLSQMESDFDKTGGMLGNTMKQLTAFANTSHGRQFCYLTLFIVFVFVVTYLFFYR